MKIISYFPTVDSESQAWEEERVMGTHTSEINRIDWAGKHQIWQYNDKNSISYETHLLKYLLHWLKSVVFKNWNLSTSLSLQSYHVWSLFKFNQYSDDCSVIEKSEREEETDIIQPPTDTTQTRNTNTGTRLYSIARDLVRDCWSWAETEGEMERRKEVGWGGGRKKWEGREGEKSERESTCQSRESGEPWHHPPYVFETGLKLASLARMARQWAPGTRCPSSPAQGSQACFCLWVPGVELRCSCLQSRNSTHGAVPQPFHGSETISLLPNQLLCTIFPRRQLEFYKDMNGEWLSITILDWFSIIPLTPVDCKRSWVNLEKEETKIEVSQFLVSNYMIKL